MRALFPIRAGDVPLRPDGVRSVAPATAVLAPLSTEELLPPEPDADWPQRAAKKSKKAHKKAKKETKKDKKKRVKVAVREAAVDPAALELEMLEQNRVMNERLSGGESHNVELWLAFAALQTRYFKGEALRARQQSILEQAVAKNPNEHRLYLELLQIEGLVESREVLLGLFQKMLVKFNTIPEVVLSFLRFLRWRHWASVRNFSMADVRRCYAAALHSLVACGRAREGVIVKVFQDLVAMEHLAGYDERAVALLQALIEFNSVPIAQARAEFARFWSMGLPRIGSPEYDGGFAQWLQSRTRWGPKAPQRDEFDALLTLHKWSSPDEWAAKERALNSVPAPDCGDPESVATIEDVAPFLFAVVDVEPIVLFLLTACGVDVRRPSMACDEPALNYCSPEDEFAFWNGGSLAVAPDFASNVCAAMMKQSPRLYCALQLRCVLQSGHGLFEAGGSLLSGFRTSVDLFCEFAECLMRSGDLVGAVRVLESLPPSSVVYAMRAMLRLEHNYEVALPSVEEAAAALKQALEEQVPRLILWTGVVLGCLLVLKGQLREAVSLFESVADALSGEVEEAVVCRGLLLEAYLMALQRAEGWDSDTRQAVVTAVAGTALRVIPTSKVVLRALQQQCSAKLALSVLDTTLAVAPNAILAVEAARLAPDADGHRYLEQALSHDRHGLGIWMAYLDLVATSRKESEKMLCRALRTMPWSKVVWLRMMDVCVADDDKRELFRLMIQKHVRTCHAMR